jgi:hypothetical protein
VLKAQLGLEKANEKLLQWYLLDFEEFAQELKKSKITLRKKDSMEWLEIFEKEKASDYQSNIQLLDKEIDEEVF